MKERPNRKFHKIVYNYFSSGKERTQVREKRSGFIGEINSNRARFEEGYMENTISYLSKHLFNSHLLND